MVISCDKILLLVSKYLSLWSWPSLELANFGGVLFHKRILLILSMCFLYFVIMSPCKKDVAIHLNKLESHSPKNALCHVLLKLALWFWRIRFFKMFVNIFSLFCNYLPLKNDVTLHLNKLESPSSKIALRQLALCLWRRRFLKISSMYFCYFVIISPSRRTWNFICTNLYLLHP